MFPSLQPFPGALWPVLQEVQCSERHGPDVARGKQQALPIDAASLQVCSTGSLFWELTPHLAHSPLEHSSLPHHSGVGSPDCPSAERPPAFLPSCNHALHFSAPASPCSLALLVSGLQSTVQLPQGIHFPLLCAHQPKGQYRMPQCGGLSSHNWAPTDFPNLTYTLQHARRVIEAYVSWTTKMRLWEFCELIHGTLRALPVISNKEHQSLLLLLTTSPPPPLIITVLSTRALQRAGRVTCILIPSWLHRDSSSQQPLEKANSEWTHEHTRT